MLRAKIHILLCGTVPHAFTARSVLIFLTVDMVAKLAKAKDPKPLESWIETHAVETRPLEQAVEEGVAMATRLAECVGAATASGDFGHGHEVKTCEGVSEEGGDCEEEDGCEICRTDVEPW